MKFKLGKLTDRLVKFISSSTFLYIVITLFVVQALWIAISFRFPMIYDEGTHLTFIGYYTETIFPYTDHTPGNMTTQVSLFHYLLSFVYRILDSFTNDSVMQIIILRVINITFVAFGLFIFAKVLKAAGFRQAYINSGLLIFTLLPITPLVAATINYDNLLFTLTAVYMLIAVRVVNNPKISHLQLVALITAGCISSLVKNTFLPIFLASIIFIAILLIRRHRKKLINLYRSSVKRISLRVHLVVALLAFVAVGLFSIVYVQNVLIHGALSPGCTDTRSLEECRKSAIFRRNEVAAATAEERPALPLANFTYQVWFNNMLETTNFSGNATTKGTIETRAPLPIIDIFFFGFVVLGVAGLLLAWRQLPKNASWYMLTVLVVVLVAFLYLTNVRGYYINHEAFANQPRYLLTVVPIIIVMIIAAYGQLLGKYRGIKLLLFGFVLLIFTQGGGVITHIVRSEPTWYRTDERIIMMNHDAQDLLRRLVKD